MRAVWLAAGLLVALLLVVELHDVLLVFFAAAIFAVPLHGASSSLARRLRLPLPAGLAIVLLALGAVLGAIVFAWENIVAAQVAQLLAALPAALAYVARALREGPWAARLAAYVPDLGSLLTGAGGLVGALRGVLGGTAAALLDAAILVFAAVCFALEPRTYVGGLLRLVSPARRARVDAALAEAGGTIGLWLVARLISMVTIATISTIGLDLLGIPDPLALGILAGIFAFVPNVGPIAAAIPSLVLAAPLGWQRVVAVLVLYWVAHAIDDLFVIPIAERRVVRLPPALTIAAQLVLGLASGILGVMMAAPFVAVAIVLVHRLVVEDVVERHGAGELTSPSAARSEETPRIEQDRHRTVVEELDRHGRPEAPGGDR